MTRIKQTNNRFYNNYPYESLKSKFDWLKGLYLQKSNSSTYETDIKRIQSSINIVDFDKYEIVQN